MQIKTFYDAPTSTFTYLVQDESTRDAVIIDPVLDYDPRASRTSTDSVDAVTAFVKEHGLNVHYILETHAHADHLSGAQLLKRRLGAPVAIGEHIKTVQQTFAAVFDREGGVAVDGSQFDRLLEDGAVVEAGKLRIEVLHTPGHTPACVSYKIEDAVFTGDALFIEDQGTGRCDFPMGSAEALYRSIRERLYALPDTTRVFVGHDYQPGGREVRHESTIGQEKAANVQLDGSTTREAFLEFRQRRDASLQAPKLLFPSIQVNAFGGFLPPKHANGQRYLLIPLNRQQPTDDLGAPE